MYRTIGGEVRKWIAGAGGNSLAFDFRNGVLRIRRVTPAIAGPIFDDLAGLVGEIKEFDDETRDRVLAAEAIMEERLDSAAEDGSLVCN